MAFFRGQKVVCVAGDWRPHSDVSIYPQKDKIYTIRKIRHDYDGPEPGCYLMLEEIINAPFKFDGKVEEPAYNSVGFRPIVTTDISIFTAMLNTKPLRLPEEV